VAVSSCACLQCMLGTCVLRQNHTSVCPQAPRHNHSSVALALSYAAKMAFDRQVLPSVYLPRAAT
jgi:hypothetical protein